MNTIDGQLSNPTIDEEDLSYEQYDPRRAAALIDGVHKALRVLHDTVDELVNAGSEPTAGWELADQVMLSEMLAEFEIPDDSPKWCQRFRRWEFVRQLHLGDFTDLVENAFGENLVDDAGYTRPVDATK